MSEKKPYRPTLPPKAGYIEINGEYVKAISEPVIDVPKDIEGIRQHKLTEISTACHETIIAGVDVETSQGTEHFSLDIDDQINISNNALQAQMDSPTLYHADGEVCRMFAPLEMIAVATAAVTHKTYHTTYHNHLKQWVIRETDIDTLNGIVYGADLPSDLAANMAVLLGQGGDTNA